MAEDGRCRPGRAPVASPFRELVAISCAGASARRAGRRSGNGRLGLLDSSRAALDGVAGSRAGQRRVRGIRGSRGASCGFDGVCVAVGLP